MKVFILGTSGDSILTSKNILFSSGIVFYDGFNQIHYDPGSNVLYSLKRAGLNVRNTNIILNSHVHFNHASGIVDLIVGMTYNGLDNKGLIIGTELLFKNNNLINIPFRFQSFSEKNIVMKDKEKVEVNNVLIESFSSKHSIESLGFVIKDNFFSIGLPGDTVFDENYFENFKNLDLLILNSKYGFDYKNRSNNSSTKNDNKNKNFDLNLDGFDIVKIIDFCKPKNVVLTHFSYKLFNSGLLYFLREVKKNITHKCNVILARDFSVLEFDNNKNVNLKLI